MLHFNNIYKIYSLYIIVYSLFCLSAALKYQKYTKRHVNFSYKVLQTKEAIVEGQRPLATFVSLNFFFRCRNCTEKNTKSTQIGMFKKILIPYIVKFFKSTQIGTDKKLKKSGK